MSQNGHNFSCMRNIHAKFGFEIELYHQGIRLCPVHKGQSGVTMATNFGTKVAINAYKCISTRDRENVITHNGVFVVDQSKDCLLYTSDAADE